MTDEKKDRKPRKQLADRLKFIDQQIAEAQEWIDALKLRRVALIQREQDKAAAILAALPTDTTA